MDTKKALQAVQIAQYHLCRLYLGDEGAVSEIAVASTAVPLQYAELSQALHTAEEFLTDEATAWEERAVAFHADGVVRVRTLTQE